MLNTDEVIDLGSGLTVGVVSSGNSFRHDIYQDHMIIGAFGAHRVVTEKSELRGIIAGMRDNGSLFGDLTADMFGEDDVIE